MIAASHLDEQCEAFGVGHFAAHRGDDEHFLLSGAIRFGGFSLSTHVSISSAPTRALKCGRSYNSLMGRDESVPTKVWDERQERNSFNEGHLMSLQKPFDGK
jgi:hypothetical protein